MTPASFTREDFANRIKRAAKQAEEEGLTGVLVTPGPDLTYLTGYSPIAITERITMLAISASGEAALIVPILERPDAEAAPGAGLVSFSAWADGVRIEDIVVGTEDGGRRLNNSSREMRIVS